MSIYTPVMNGENDESPENNRSHGSSSDWSRSNTSDSGDSPGSYRNSIMPPPPPPSQSKKPSICKWITAFSIPLIRRARSIAFGFIILSCGREGLSLTNVLVSSCTCQDTLPLLSKGGNQGALVLVKLNFQTPSPFITHFFSCFHPSLFQFDPRPLAFVHLTYELFLHAFHMSFFSFNLEPCNSHRWEPEEGQVVDTDPSNHLQHPTFQPQPLQRPNQLGGNDPAALLPESLFTTAPQEVAQQRFRERGLPISHPGVLPHG